MTLIVFLFILSFLVFIHEAGHFLAARFFGVTVEEFGLGYPPTIKTLFTRWGTAFTLNWLPFGGFVRLAGEERITTTEKLKLGDDPGQFFMKPAWQRILVIVAGATVNFAFGIIAFSIIFTFLGIPEPFRLQNRVVLSQIIAGSPADQKGLISGDTVVYLVIDGRVVKVEGLDSFVQLLKDQGGKIVGIVYDRHNLRYRADVYVRRPDEIPENQGALGVAITDQTLEFIKYPIWQMPFRGAWTGIKAAVDFGFLIVVALGDMVGGLFVGNVPKDLTGPAGIVYQAHKEGILEEGILGILNFAAILSINLAILNVMPFPALDGGRVLFILLEKILGKYFKPEFEQYANALGMGTLLLIIVLVSIRDVRTIFVDQGFTLSHLLARLKGS